MTINAFYMALAAGAFAILCVVAWHLVLALKQARRTASALEAFLASTQPRIIAATDQFNALMGRTEKILSAAEKGESGVSVLLGGLGQALAGWAAGGKLITILSTVVSSALGVWKAMANRNDESTAGPDPAGGTHERTT